MSAPKAALGPSITTEMLDPDGLTLADYRQGPAEPMPKIERRVPGVDPLPEPDRWWERAACRGMDPDLFFVGRGESLAEARKVCAGCSVREECLAYALDNCEKHGVWAGTSEKQRRRMRRERRAA